MEKYYHLFTSVSAHGFHSISGILSEGRRHQSEEDDGRYEKNLHLINKQKYLNLTKLFFVF